MVQILDFGHSTEAQCLEVVMLFAAIDAPDVRKNVVTLMKALVTSKNEVLSLSEITFS